MSPAQSPEIDDEIRRIGAFFSQVSKHFVTDLEKAGLKRHTKAILEYFSREPIKGLNILEMGCGVGGLLFALLRMGANSVIGLDLSEEMIVNAKNLAESHGFIGKTKFYVGDFNRPLPSAETITPDVIIADRVYCCSPVSFDILDRTLSLEPRYIVIVLPRKNPIFRKLWDYKLRLRNLYWGVKRPSKPHYYPASEIRKIAKANGYRLDLQRFRYVWETLIFKRDISPQENRS